MQVMIILAMMTVPTGVDRVKEAPHQKLYAVDFTHVKIEDRFWTPRLEANRTATLAANLRKCEDTGRLSNFAKAARLMEGKFQGIFFDDSDVYKVLEGASYILAAHPDPELDKKIDQIIAWIAAAQQPDGYLNTYHTLVAPDKRWANLPVMHELYCAGHLFEAAVAHNKATGKTTLLDVATRFADYIDQVFGKGKNEGVPGHEEIELALVKLYRLTGQERYRKLAEFFIEQRGQNRDEKHRDLQMHLPVREQTDIVGHAVRAMYLYSGVADVAAMTGDPGYFKTMDRIWENVVFRKMYITGGIGNSKHNEGFTKDYDLGNDTAYAETCASIGMVLWNHRLNLLHGQGRFADVLERVLYNGLLSGVSLEGAKFFYVNPLASRGTHHRQPWYNCACCPTNVVRFIASLGGYVYAQTSTGVWVNLYLSNTARIDLKDGAIEVKQETNYPWSGQVKLTVNPAKTMTFDVNMRIPAWCRTVKCSVNGATLKEIKPEQGYLRISREWKAGAIIDLDLPMEVERMEARPEVEADVGRVALQRGPLVYCFEGVDQEVPPRSIALPRNAEIRAEHRSDLLGGVTVIVADAIAAGTGSWGQDLYRQTPPARRVRATAVPYYSWDNRSPGQMVVWIPESLSLTEQMNPQTVAGQAKPSASISNEADMVTALNDGVVPANSNDQSIPRFTWWDHKGTVEWVALEFDKPQRVSAAEVYWFDDSPTGGGCRVPKSWRLLLKDGEVWKPVTAAGEYGTKANQFNRVSFKAVKTTGIRIEAQLQEGYSGGVLEWRLAE